MYRNIHYNTYNNQIHLWETINGERQYSVIDWVPYVYINTPDNIKNTTKSIYGDDVIRKRFDTYKDYQNYQQNNFDISENKIQPTIQFLTEKYHSFKDPEIPKLHIAYLDIETPHNDGFPNIIETPAEVCLISVVDETNKKTIFGINPYNGKNKDIDFIYCRSEDKLLISFFNWMHDQKFDVYTGWNIASDNKTNRYGGFDLPYLIRRTKKIFGEKTNIYKRLSPVNNVRIWAQTKIEGVYNVTIAGVSILDYLALYKWFTTKNLESYKLDYVSEEELGKHKLDYSEYDSMWDFYKNDWEGFVDYCLNDSDLVKYLEEKCGYISLAQTLSGYCCVPINNYNSSVALIEGLMLKYFRNNNLCAPRLSSGTQDWFPAALVDIDKPGMFQDVVDLDIASSYPTAIITLNMSLETYFGRIVGFNKQDIRDFKTDKGLHEPLHLGRPFYDEMVKCCRNRKFPEFYILKDIGYEYYNDKKLEKFNAALKRQLISIAPNGSVFYNKPKGVMAVVEKETYDERVKQKGLKKKYKQLSIDTEGAESKKYKEMSQNRHVLQWAIKILINSMFGIMGVPYSRYFNPHMAEAITSCGRHTIKQGRVYVNELLNDPNQEILNIIDEIKKLC